MLPWGCGGRACLRDAMMYLFCLRAHRFICIIFIWPTFFAKKYQSPRGLKVEKRKKDNCIFCYE